MNHLRRLAQAVSIAALLAAPTAVFADDTLRVTALQDLKNLDPIFTTAHVTRDHGYMVYDTLFAMDENLVARPQMVDSFELSEDELIYTFTLRSGLNFSDGAPVTSTDVIASLKRWGQRASLGKMLLAKAEALEAASDDTFIIRLKEPFGQVIEALAMPSGNVPFIMPARIASISIDEQITDPIGSGPFIFVAEERVPGSQFVYVKNPNYVPRNEPASGLAGGKVVNIHRIEFKVLSDPNTAFAALSAGEIDITLQPTPEQVAPMRDDPNINVVISQEHGSQGWIRFNFLIPPFDDIKARQAVMWGASQLEYLTGTVGDPALYTECLALFVCGTPLATDINTEALATKNMAKAKELLAESSYDGRPVVLLDPTDNPQHHGASQITAQLLRDIGFNVEVQAMNVSTMFQRRAIKDPVDSGGWNIFHTGFALVDVANPLTNAAINTVCDGTNWPGWPCDEGIEEIRRAFAESTDDAEKKQLAEELQDAVMNFVTHVSYGQYLKPIGYRKEVENLITTWVGPVYWNVSKN